MIKMEYYKIYKKYQIFLKFSNFHTIFNFQPIFTVLMYNVTNPTTPDPIL